MQNEDRFDQL